MKNVQYWLAELDQYGNPTLKDGMHSHRSGVVRAMDIYRELGFDTGRKFAMAKVEIMPIYSDERGNIMERTITVKDENELYLHGQATDHIWCMEDKPGFIGIRMDSGDSGTVYLTHAQARDLAEQLSSMAERGEGR